DIELRMTTASVYPQAGLSVELRIARDSRTEIRVELACIGERPIHLDVVRQGSVKPTQAPIEPHACTQILVPHDRRVRRRIGGQEHWVDTSLAAKHRVGSCFEETGLPELAAHACFG